ncbi:MAG: hypothetical protein KN64_14310 [Sulfurovum sp. AS07-7]|nr:MAG: hypothetical protein KN64_14310 [Sulfurovum sp. AS07-7]
MTTDILVIGSGGAGLSAALRAKKLGCSVIVATKTLPTNANTSMAQGGFNASSNEDIQIHIDDTIRSSRGDDDWEEKAYKIMKQPSFHITCDLGLGNGTFTSYGCDLSYDYVKINAEYRT